MRSTGWALAAGIASSAIFAIVSKLFLSLDGWRWWSASALFAAISIVLALWLAPKTRADKPLVGSQNRAGGRVDINVKAKSAAKDSDIGSANSSKSDMNIDVDLDN